MGTEIWNTSTDIESLLKDQCHNLSFYQAIKMIERYEWTNVNDNNGGKASQKTKQPIGEYALYDQEIIQFKGQVTLGYIASEINTITAPSKKNDQQWQMTISFIGLLGTLGVLPYHYTELVLLRLKSKDKALKNFIDLFLHRTVSLFYKAHLKYRQIDNYQRYTLAKNRFNKTTSLDKILESLTGVLGAQINQRLTLNPMILYRYAGFIGRNICSVNDLKLIISDFCQLPVSIKEFIKQTYPMDSGMMCRLGQLDDQGRPINASLGVNCLLASHYPLIQQMIGIYITVENYQQYIWVTQDKLLTQRIAELVRISIGMSLDFYISLMVKLSVLPVYRLDKAAPHPLMLGINTCFNQSLRVDKTVEIKLRPYHKNRMNFLLTTAKLYHNNVERLQYDQHRS